MRGTNEEQRRITRESLLTALMELWDTMPYERITVAGLTRRAGVSRMAFYRNYESIDQIVIEHMRRLYAAYIAHTVRDGHTRFVDYSVRFFQYVAENERFMRQALAAGFACTLLESIEDYVGSAGAVRIADVDMTRFGDERLRHFVAGGYLVVLMRWLAGGMAETPEEVGKATAAYVMGLLGPGPATALTPAWESTRGEAWDAGARRTTIPPHPTGIPSS